MAYADLRAFLHMLDGEAYGWSWVTTNHRFSVPIEPHGYQRLSMICVGKEGAMTVSIPVSRTGSTAGQSTYPRPGTELMGQMWAR
jgi:hypothetical protein